MVCKRETIYWLVVFAGRFDIRTLKSFTFFYEYGGRRFSIDKLADINMLLIWLINILCAIQVRQIDQIEQYYIQSLKTGIPNVFASNPTTSYCSCTGRVYSLPIFHPISPISRKSISILVIHHPISLSPPLLIVSHVTITIRPSILPKTFLCVFFPLSIVGFTIIRRE